MAFVGAVPGAKLCFYHSLELSQLGKVPHVAKETDFKRLSHFLRFAR